MRIGGTAPRTGPAAPLGLRAFFTAVDRDGWRGQEREAVTLFAFEFLVPHARGAAMEIASQIGIECTVPQVASGGKRQVCKDIVIWPRPRRWPRVPSGVLTHERVARPGT